MANLYVSPGLFRVWLFVVRVQLVSRVYVSSRQDLHAIIGAIFIPTGVTYMCTRQQTKGFRSQ